MKHKIHLNNIKVKDLSVHGKRKHPIKRNKKPYEIQSYNREKNKEVSSPYVRRIMYQGLISLAIIVCVLIISSVDYKIFNDAEKGLDYLVNHEFTFYETFSVFNIKTDSENTSLPTLSESEIVFAKPTTGEALSDLLDENNTPVGLIYSMPDNKCYCACNGVVFYVDKVSAVNPYIRVRHDEGFDTLYMGIVSDVEVGDNVEKGQVLGSGVGDSMGFVLLKNSKYTDIKSYMNTVP